MKKLILSLTALATMAFAFTSCEDVPEPYAQPSVNPDTTVVVQPAGTGTAADPYNVAMALQIIKDGTYTSANVYTKGILTSVDIDTNYGSATYYISDIANNAETTLEVYRGYYYNGNKFTSDDQLAVGDTVVVYGVLTNYSGTYEITYGSQIYSINGKTNGTTPDTPTTQPSGSGTEADPYNVAAALNLINGLAADATTSEIYVKGKVSSIREISTSYGNATYYISDDGTTGTQLYIYHSKYLNNEKFTSTDQLKVGDEVVIVGTFTNYKGNTPESSANKSHLVSIKSNGSTDTPDTPDTPTGDADVEITASSLGLANTTLINTQTLSNGITLTGDAGSNQNAPTFYSAGGGTIRMYPANSLTITASSNTISQIVLECDSYNGVDYIAEGKMTASPGTVSLSSLTYTVSSINGKTVTLTNSETGSGGKTQLRIKSIKIYYAK